MSGSSIVGWIHWESVRQLRAADHYDPRYSCCDIQHHDDKHQSSVLSVPAQPGSAFWRWCWDAVRGFHLSLSESGNSSCTRFFPSLAAISTHFSKNRSTALGIAASGSGLGNCTYKSAVRYGSQRFLVGGVVYPIILQRLFNTVGFAWATRIGGFITLALCIIATATVTSGCAKRHSGPWFDLQMFKDKCFVLLVIASISLSIGAASTILSLSSFVMLMITYRIQGSSSPSSTSLTTPLIMVSPRPWLSMFSPS